LFHPHPWPSIVRIVEGGYWTKTGRVDGWKDYWDKPHAVYCKVPEERQELFLGPGSIIVDNDKWSWHSVAPTKVTYSLMITGKPWGMSHWKHGLVTKPEMELKTLSKNAVLEILATFENWYDGEENIA
jgi:hypothetical protein